MSSYRKFDPDKVACEIDVQGLAAAKAAKTARVLEPGAPTLAALAGLAETELQSEHRAANHSPWLDAAGLRERYRGRATIHRSGGGQSGARAETRAWLDVAAIWHRQHGERSPAGICAGCGEPLGGQEIIALPHGDRVHAGPGDSAFQCLHLYGRRWKTATVVALVALGIPAPAEEGEEACR